MLAMLNATVKSSVLDDIEAGRLDEASTGCYAAKFDTVNDGNVVLTRE